MYLHIPRTLEGFQSLLCLKVNRNYLGLKKKNFKKIFLLKKISCEFFFPETLVMSWGPTTSSPSTPYAPPLLLCAAGLRAFAHAGEVFLSCPHSIAWVAPYNLSFEVNCLKEASHGHLINSIIPFNSPHNTVLFLQRMSTASSWSLGPRPFLPPFPQPTLHGGGTDPLGCVFQTTSLSDLRRGSAFGNC